MELSEYIKIIKKNLIIIFAFSILGLGVALFFQGNFKNTPRFEKQFFLHSMEENLENTYRFEGFYSQERARNFTDSAVSIITSPDLLGEVLSPNERLIARKIAPQVIRLSVETKSLENAKSIFDKASYQFNQKIQELTEDDNVKLKPLGTVIVPASTKPPAYALYSFGVLSGALFALVAISLKTYFKL